MSQGTITGNFRLNMDLYELDSSIATVGPNYTTNKNSANAWFQLKYSDYDKGVEAAVRFDGNYNSILQNPPTPVSFYGIGNWYVKKKIDDLEVTAGYIYEQYGSGVALRTFEARNLGIDNAIFGVKASYNLNDNYRVRAIAGTQRFQLDFFESFVKGVNLEGSLFSDKISSNFGLSVVNRTLTNDDRTQIANAVNQYNDTTPENYYKVPYNAYVFNAYNTLEIGRVSWYVEGAFKTNEAVNNPYNSIYYNRPGYSIMNSVSYSKKGFGITWQERIVQHFQFQSTGVGGVTDFNVINNRRLSFFAPLNKQHSLRLPARFQIAPIDFSEVATTLDVTISPNKKTHMNLNLAYLDSGLIKRSPYYREVYFDIEHKKMLNGRIDIHGGLQYVFYNQKQYIFKGVDDVVSYTAFIEPTFRINRKQSLRFELQYQHAAKDLGQTIFALLEYNLAPGWSFSISDLWNFAPNKNYEVVTEYQNSHHFYNAFISYTKNATRFTLAYAKQLAGVVCTGGVCRFEPAFSGVRMQVTSSF